MRIDTSLNIINDALLELGLVTTAYGSTVYSSTEPTAIMARVQLKALGRELTRLRPWTHLQRTHSLSISDVVDNYAMPADFVSMIHSTHWDLSQPRPMGNPYGPQEWQYLKNSVGGNTGTHYLYRVKANRIYIHPDPEYVTDGDIITFEYQSAFWVQPSGQTLPTTETPTAPTDSLWFDSRLLVSGLKMKILETKGFDSAAARNDYERALSESSGNDGAAPVLSITGAQGSRMVGFSNLPSTGWGS